MPTICYSCGRIGNRKGVYPYTIIRLNHGQEQDGVNNDVSGTEVNMVDDGGTSTSGSTTDSPKYWLWIQVQNRNSRRYQGKNRSTNFMRNKDGNPHESRALFGQ